MRETTAPPSRSAIHCFMDGLRAYTRVAGTLTRHRLWHYQILPALVSLALSAALITGMFIVGGNIAGWVDAKVNLETAWLDKLVTYSVGILTFLAMLVGFFFLHKHIVIVALSPFLGRLAENIIRASEGEKPTPALTTVQSVRRAAHISIRSVILELSVTAALIACGFLFPPLSLLTTPLALLMEARFVGGGLIDFPLEYRGYSVARSIEYSRSHRATATGIGAGYILLMLIPVIGWMFAPTFGTAAGTISTLDELKRQPPEAPP
jgi:CysZ protein